MTLVYGDTSNLDATNSANPNTNDTQEIVQLIGNRFDATDGPSLIAMPNDTFGLLYFVAINQTATDGLLELQRLIRPDYKALAGLSAFEVSKVMNFNLTEDDRLKTTTGDGDSNTIEGGYWGDRVYGGDGDDTISGLGSDDDLNGEGGDDILLGGVSNDRLFGGDGNDLLNGGTGDDLMQGDLGDDTFILDSLGDRVVDAPNQGDLDWVKTPFSLVLNDIKGGGDPLEIERLSTTNSAGTADLNLTGNEFAQTIIGNDGKNSINGLGGADRMEGRGGFDVYYVDDVTTWSSKRWAAAATSSP